MWPDALRFSFEPELVIYNERGAPVAQAGTKVELTQVAGDEGPGTYDEPYLADGLLLAGCYPFVG